MLSKDKQPVASSGRVGGNSVTLEDQGHARPSKPKDRAVLKVFREATNLMFIHKRKISLVSIRDLRANVAAEMESLFRQFDLDGSGNNTHCLSHVDSLGRCDFEGRSPRRTCFSRRGGSLVDCIDVLHVAVR